MRVHPPRSPFWELAFEEFNNRTWHWQRDDETTEPFEQYVIGASGYWPREPWPVPTPAFVPDALPRRLAAPPDAVAFSGVSSWFASPKLQRFFETKVGDAVTFLPVRVLGPHRALAHGYKFVAFRDTLDILHDDSWDIEDDGSWGIVSPIVDTSLIPGGTLIGNIRFSSGTGFIHESLKRAILNAGLTGFILNRRLPEKGNAMGQFLHDYRKKPGQKHDLHTKNFKNDNRSW